MYLCTSSTNLTTQKNYMYMVCNKFYSVTSHNWLNETSNPGNLLIHVHAFMLYPKPVNQGTITCTCINAPFKSILEINSLITMQLSHSYDTLVFTCQVYPNSLEPYWSKFKMFQVCQTNMESLKSFHEVWNLDGLSKLTYNND